MLAEIYDATPTDSYTRTTPRLINFSVLKQIPVGDVLTAGIVIGGVTSQRVLLRAIGPTLAREFGVAGAMKNPSIELRDSKGSLVVSNSGWSGPELSTTFGKVGAFKLQLASKDAAVVVTLKPGRYHAHVNGSEGTGGVTLFEVYEVP